MIHIYHGNGKGKTTASVGLAVRMAGFNKKVLFTQFLKCGTSCELDILKKCENITILCKPKPHGFFITLSEEAKDEVKKECNDLFNEITNNTASLIVLDEILDAINLGILEEKKVISFLESKKENTEIVLTGRNPSEKMTGIADYVTKMQCEKHPFEKGIQARKGIEF